MDRLTEYTEDGKYIRIKGTRSLYPAQERAGAPTADVAPVVQCWGCKNYNKPRLGWCSVHMDRENPDDFCSYGERKDNGEIH